MTRTEVIERVLKLHAFTCDEYIRVGMRSGDLKPQLTCEWFGRKSSRFYIVEESSHREEDFSSEVTVHYGLRSQERHTLSNGYERSLSTYPMKLEHVYDMTLDEAKSKITELFDKVRESIS